MAWKDLLVRVGMDSRGFAKGASDLKRDTQGMKNSMAQLATEMRKQRDQLKQLGQDGKGASNEYRRLKASIAENNGAFRAMARELRAVEMAQGKVQTSTSTLSSSFSGLSAINFAGITAMLGGVVSFSKIIGEINTFEQSVANLKAISGGTAEEMKKLEQTARDVAKASSFTADQVINLQTELSKLGFNVGDISMLTQSVVDLSTALDADATEAATLLGGQLRAFGKDASYAAEYAEVLGAAANKTAVDFDDFALMLPKVSKAASVVGWDFAQLNATLGVLRDNNIKAEAAGTSLRNILLKNAKDGRTYKEGLDLIANSTNKLATATDLYGSENAIVGLTLADNQQRIAESTVEIRGMTGALAEMNAAKLDTVTGQTLLLKSAFSELVLVLNNGQSLKGVVSIAGDVVKAFTQLAEHGVILGKHFDEAHAKRMNQVDETVKKYKEQIAAGKTTQEQAILFIHSEINAMDAKLKKEQELLKSMNMLTPRSIKDKSEIRIAGYKNELKALTKLKDAMSQDLSMAISGVDPSDTETTTTTTTTTTTDKAAKNIKTAASAYSDLNKELQLTRDYLKFVGQENEYIGEAINTMSKAQESIYKMGGEEAIKYATLVKQQLEGMLSTVMVKVEPLAPLGPTKIKPPEQMKPNGLDELIARQQALNDKKREGVLIEGDIQNSMNQTMMMADMMGGAMGGLFERLASGYEGAGGALQGFAIEALNMAQTLISANLAVASSAIAKWAQAFGPAGPIIAAGAIAGVFGLVKGAIGKSKGVKLAKGGLAYGETMATVGDNPGARFDPEVVAPLSKLQGMLETRETVGGTFRIDGADLVLAYDNAKRKTKAFGR